MGINASYVGSGGGVRTFDLEGVPSSGTPAAAVLGAQPISMPNFAAMLPSLSQATPPSPAIPAIPSMADASEGKVSVLEGDRPDVLSRKLLPGGSIVTNGNMLCLKGEEGGVGGGSRIYGASRGRQGFLSFAEIDPEIGGVILDSGGDNADGSAASFDGSQGGRVRIGGRTVATVEKVLGDEGAEQPVYDVLNIKEFYRLADVTPNGRIVRISNEVERLLLKYILGSGSGSGKYGVRPFFDPPTSEDEKLKPHLVKLAFGAEEDLDTWNEEKERFDCNYDDSGMLLEDPPVKIVETAHCAYAPEDDGSGDEEEGEE